MSDLSPYEAVTNLNHAIETCKQMGLSTTDLQQALAQHLPAYKLDVRIGRAVQPQMNAHLHDAKRGAVVRLSLLGEGLRIVDTRVDAGAVAAPTTELLRTYYGEEGEHPQFQRRQYLGDGTRPAGDYWSWVVAQIAACTEPGPVTPVDPVPEFTISQGRVGGDAQAVVAVAHPNGGLSEVVMTLDIRGLAVNVVGSETNQVTITADGKEGDAMVLEASR